MIESIRNDFCEASDPLIFGYILTFVATGLLLAILLGVFRDSFKTYREGQLDALNGNAKYCLKEFKNGERRWVERDKTDMDFPEDHLIENKGR